MTSLKDYEQENKGSNLEMTPMTLMMIDKLLSYKFVTTSQHKSILINSIPIYVFRLSEKKYDR